MAPARRDGSAKPDGGKTRIVVRSDRCAARIVGIEMRQLRSQDRRLQRIEARIHAGDVADIALAPAIFAQLRDALGERCVVGHHHAAIADGAQILGRIKAEGGDVAEAAEPPVAEPRAVRLGAILDDPRAVPPRKIEDRVEIGGLAVEMDRHDRGDAPAFGGERAGKRRGIEVHRRRIYIDEIRPGARQLDRGHGRDRGMRHGGDVIVGTKRQRPEGNHQRIGAAGDADRVAAADIGGEGALERLDLGAENVGARIENPRDRGVDRGAVRQIGCARIGRRDEILIRHHR